MRVSLIIPSLNATTLPQTLAAVTQQASPPDEIIVVGRDDAGIVSGYPEIQFIDTGVPVCAAAARNMGIRAATGDLLVFTDADCLPEPEWLRQHLRRQEAGECVVGGSVIVNGDSYWARSDNVSMFHEFVPQHSAGYRILLPTLNLSVRRAVIEAVGELDESFPGAAAEDADWTIRMRKSGYRLYFEPSARVVHAPARTRWSDVVPHWRRLGHNAVRVRLRYARELQTPFIFRRSLWLRVLSPLIAAHVTLKVYRTPGFWRYWRSLPVVYLTKILYCLGAAESVDSGYAFEQ